MYVLITWRCSILTPPKFDKQQLYLYIMLMFLSLQLKAGELYGDLTKYSYYLVSEKLFFKKSAQFGGDLSQGCVANAVQEMR